METMFKKSDLYGMIHKIECPFREFRDNELTADFWGLGPATFQDHLTSRTTKHPPDQLWVDEQVQPLPSSVRRYLHGWIRAGDLATRRWGAEVVVYEESIDKMSVLDTQVSHAQVITRSPFCRRVLSACYMLERVESFSVEHQWEHFAFNIGPEGWRARHHIYSPGLKPGGGQQHRPTISKNGCYLVRLFYLGAWRCIWVSDQVPVDATDAPLLPFSPLLNRAPPKATKQVSTCITSNVVQLWPLLLCKALLKLAAPDMSSEDFDDNDDELIKEFNILHSLTGAIKVTYKADDAEDMWKLLSTEVPVFSWDNDGDKPPNTVRSKTKKPITKESAVVKRSSMASITINDTLNYKPYFLPGISPGYEMELIVMMIRDLPLKKPLPEPEIPLWKTYRWVDWARSHGLYEEYDCPRTRFLKLSGLLKLSHAPHLIDVVSTDSLTAAFREQQGKVPATRQQKKSVKEANKSSNSVIIQKTKDELREWIQFDVIFPIIKQLDVLYFPYMYQFPSIASNPPLRLTKAHLNKAIDVEAPKSSPLYLQIDGPNENILRISLQTLHPRILYNSGGILYDIEPAYLLLEAFEWFEDYEVPITKGYVQTRGYRSMEVKFKPGRHICRIWIHSQLQYHVMLLSKSSILLGSRDVILSAAVKECPWAADFLLKIGTAFATWIRINKSTVNITRDDKEFYKSYQPDLEWIPQVVGYSKIFRHWMFKQALQNLLMRRLTITQYREVCTVLRRYFRDPDFGLPPKPFPPEPLKDLNFSNSPKTSNVCQFANEELPCDTLGVKRDIMTRKNKAATLIQAIWRGTWARKCLNRQVIVSPEILKLLMDNVFGNIEVLSELINEFFTKYPGARSAYSLSSALTGTNSLQQYSGTVQITPKCKWIPYFQEVFYCHASVKVHFDLKSPFRSMVAVYDNDAGHPMPQAYSAHITYDIKPNVRGYTVMGHAKLLQPQSIHSEVHWQLTVLCSLPDAFHVCDNDLNRCKESPLSPASKYHHDELFVPNRKNILCGIQISVTKSEIISFRAEATSTKLKMEAVLRITNDGLVEEVGRCPGIGELYWPYILLEPLARVAEKPSTSHISSPTIKEMNSHCMEPKLYTIEVTAPNGWPLTTAQWIRVNEFRNSLEPLKSEVSMRRPLKEKGESAKNKNKNLQPSHQPQPGDAYIEVECALAGDNISVRRDDEREQLFLDMRSSWRTNDSERTLKCEQFRKEFREEFLEPAPSESTLVSKEENGGEVYEEEIEVSDESGDESMCLCMPEKLKDKFIPLHFIPFCTKELSEKESVLMTPEMMEAAKQMRKEEIDKGLERMHELQAYNEKHVLERQKIRCQMLEKYFTNSHWSPELTKAFEDRDDIIAKETSNRTPSATKKKRYVKKK